MVRKAGSKHSMMKEEDSLPRRAKERRTRSPTPSMSSDEGTDRELSRSSSLDSLVENVKQKSEIKSKWTPRKERHMIEMWAQEPTLFDPKLRNPIKKQKILETISKTIGLDVETVRKRMNSLRTIYGKLLQKKDQMTDREEDIFELCSFLKQFMRCTEKKRKQSKKSQKNETDNKTEGNVKTENEKTENNVKTENEKTTTDSVVQTNGFDKEMDITEAEEEIVVTVQEEQTPGPSKIMSDLPKPIDKSNDFWKEYLNILRSGKAEFNLHENWGRLIAEKIKFFDTLKAEQIKHRLDGIVLQELEEWITSRAPEQFIVETESTQM